MKLSDLKNKIRNIPDFPIKGIMFRDITTLIGDPESLRFVVEHLYQRYSNKNIDSIVAIESRGFIFGGALAHLLGCGIVPARKPGKLPYETIAEEYDLEYGTASLELHNDALQAGDRVLIIDDLLATGGTLQAAADLVKRLDAEIVECAVIIELDYLNGRDNLPGVNIYSMVNYDSE